MVDTGHEAGRLFGWWADCDKGTSNSALESCMAEIVVRKGRRLGAINHLAEKLSQMMPTAGRLQVFRKDINS